MFDLRQTQNDFLYNMEGVYWFNISKTVTYTMLPATDDEYSNIMHYCTPSYIDRSFIIFFIFFQTLPLYFFIISFITTSTFFMQYGISQLSKLEDSINERWARKKTENINISKFSLFFIIVPCNLSLDNCTTFLRPGFASLDLPVRCL